MTRLVGVRAVCDVCSAARAEWFCVIHRHVSCGACDARDHAPGTPNAEHQRVDLSSAVTALPFCEHCDKAPATSYCESEGMTLCDGCDARVHRTRGCAPHQRRLISRALEMRSVSFTGTHSPKRGPKVEGGGGKTGSPGTPRGRGRRRAPASPIKRRARAAATPADARDAAARLQAPRARARAGPPLAGPLRQPSPSAGPTQAAKISPAASAPMPSAQARLQQAQLQHPTPAQQLQHAQLQQLQQHQQLLAQQQLQQLQSLQRAQLQQGTGGQLQPGLQQAGGGGTGGAPGQAQAAQLAYFQAMSLMGAGRDAPGVDFFGGGGGGNLGNFFQGVMPFGDAGMLDNPAPAAPPPAPPAGAARPRTFPANIAPHPGSAPLPAILQPRPPTQPRALAPQTESTNIAAAAAAAAAAAGERFLLSAASSDRPASASPGGLTPPFAGIGAPPDAAGLATAAIAAAESTVAAIGGSSGMRSGSASNLGSDSTLGSRPGSAIDLAVASALGSRPGSAADLAGFILPSSDAPALPAGMPSGFLQTAMHADHQKRPEPSSGLFAPPPTARTADEAHDVLGLGLVDQAGVTDLGAGSLAEFDTCMPRGDEFGGFDALDLASFESGMGQLGRRGYPLDEEGESVMEGEEGGEDRVLNV